jgi:hypothetical protein
MGDTDVIGRVIGPEPGYIGVDATVMFGDESVLGMDYGITLTNGATAGDSEKSWWATIGSETTLAMDYIWLSDDNDASFEIAVPNGKYVVTMGGGNAGWDVNELRGRMEGTVYGSTNPGAINDDVYILDVASTFRIDGGTVLGWKLEDIEVHDTLGGFGFETWGGNNSHDGDSWTHVEIGYLERQIVTVTDGRLSVFGFQAFGQEGHLCFLEVLPYTCESVIAAGFGSDADVNGDCNVNFNDFAILAEHWMECNDPDDNSCTKNW